MSQQNKLTWITSAKNNVFNALYSKLLSRFINYIRAYSIDAFPIKPIHFEKKEGGPVGQ